jgi:CHAT domain-containing protein
VTNPELRQAVCRLGLGAALFAVSASCSVSRMAQPVAVAPVANVPQENPSTQIAELATRGESLTDSGQFAEASSNLTDAMNRATALGDHHLQAHVLNDSGNLAWAQNDFMAAYDDYSRGSAILEADTDSDLEAKLNVNAAMAAAKLGDLSKVARAEAMFVGPAALLPATDSFPLWIELGDALDAAHTAAPSTNPTEAPADGTAAVPPKDAFLKGSFQAYSRAVDLAVEVGNPRSEATAYGRLSRLYGKEHRINDALKLARQAVAVAQAADLPDVSAQWECQSGRLLWASGPDNQHEAVESYWNAVDSLQRVVTTSQSQNSQFSKQNADICSEAMDCASQLTETETGDMAQADRLKILKTADQVKIAAVREYFQDACVAAYEAELSPVAAATAGTAVMYVLPFKDRTELFVAVDGKLSQATTPVGRAQIDAQATAFRQLLETRPTRRFMRPAATLYDWVIRPIEPCLASGQVNTLVVLSDGALQSIPFAPLYDGNHFLIEKYALAVSPAMRLTDFTPPKDRQTRVLAAALAESKPGLPKLAYVEDELSGIRSAFGVETLENKDFTIARMTDQLESTPYRIVHIASHGVFGKNASQTYIATGEEPGVSQNTGVAIASADRGGDPACCTSGVGKLTPSDLAKLLGISRFRDEPVELLVLSACDTAVGSHDDQAALGLAGIGIKSGARSTLATLWSINDEATSRFMAKFYQALRQEPPLSKAQAVRAAQLSLLNDPEDRRFRHPCYWSPFILAGNWK